MQEIWVVTYCADPQLIRRSETKEFTSLDGALRFTMALHPRIRVGIEQRTAGEK